MRPSARPQASELIARTAELARQRHRLERLLVAISPILAAVAGTALGFLPAWISALVALAAIAWAVAGLAARSESEVEAARRIDRGLAAKETFLTWSTVTDAGRGPLWPIVAERASEVASGKSPRLFATDFAWRRPLWSFAASLLVVLLLALFVRLAELLPPTAPEELAAIAERLSGPGKDAASRALAAELRALAEKLADPNTSNEEKRKLVAEMREKLEKQAQQRGQQGSSGGQGQQQQKSAGEQSASAGSSGQAQGEQQGEGNEAAQAAKALGQIEKELAGESQSEKNSQGKEQGQQPQGGGVQGPSEGKRAGEKSGEGTGNQPGPKEDGGKSEQGDGEGGRESSERPEGQQGQNEGQQNQSGEGRGEGSGGAGRPSPAETGQKAERYYQVGEGPEGMRVEDGRYVRVLVPEQGGGVGTERVQKPGEVSPEIPFGNAPLPSEGPPGQAEERQPLPLEYRPILRK